LGTSSTVSSSRLKTQSAIFHIPHNATQDSRIGGRIEKEKEQLHAGGLKAQKFTWQHGNERRHKQSEQRLWYLGSGFWKQTAGLQI